MRVFNSMSMGRAAIAVALVGLPATALPQAFVTERNITLNAAVEVAQGALERCRKDGYKVTVTVLDRSGRSKVVLHDDSTSPHTLENSLRKAYTSITYRVPSGEFGKRIAANPPPHPALLLDKVTTAEGALPIRAGNEIIGSVGVSGAPGGDKDAVCAQAGIDRIAKGLAGS